MTNIKKFWLKEKAATGMVWTLFRILGGSNMPTDRSNNLIKWHSSNIERIKRETKSD